MKISRVLLFIDPAFLFSAIFQRVLDIAGNSFDQDQNLWVEGTEFTWTNFTSAKRDKVFTYDFYRPSPAGCIGYLWLTSLVFIFALWIFDNIFSSNRGFSRNPLYFLFKRRSKVSANRDTIQDQINTDETEHEGVYLKVVSKSYLPSWRRKRGNKFSWALRDISLEIKPGEILGLLGPNGAGKTTMISILSGILKPTSGEFLSGGVDGITNSDDVRKFTNVCPQFDILWRELTIMDHIRLIASIKGLKHDSNGMVEFGENLMSKVGLKDSLNEKISSLSGGMQRRVSIALATIGSPKILIFDEPTTGLDPENRHLIWQFIRGMKKDQRAIMLTTHILEEADDLSDRISIMSYGQVKAEGTSEELKRKRGAGFRINIIMKDESVIAFEKVKEAVLKMCKTAVLLDDSGGALLFAVPFSSTEEVTKFLEYYEQDEDGLQNIVEDLAVSNSTLEEVFIEVTKDDDLEDDTADSEREIVDDPENEDPIE